MGEFCKFRHLELIWQINPLLEAGWAIANFSPLHRKLAEAMSQVGHSDDCSNMPLDQLMDQPSLPTWVYFRWSILQSLALAESILRRLGSILGLSSRLNFRLNSRGSAAIQFR